MIYNYITNLGIEVLSDSMTSEYDETSGLYLTRAILTTKSYTKQEILNFSEIPEGEASSSVKVSRVTGGFRIILNWGFLSGLNYHSIALLGYKAVTSTDTVIVDGEEQEVTSKKMVEVPIAVYSNTDEILISEDTDVVFRLNLAQLGSDEVKISVSDDDYVTKAELDALRDSISLPEGFTEQVTALVNEANELGGLTALKSISQDVYGMYNLSTHGFTSNVQFVLNKLYSSTTYSNIWDVASNASLQLKSVSSSSDGTITIKVSTKDSDYTIFRGSVVFEVKFLYLDTLDSNDPIQVVEPYTLLNTTSGSEVSVSIKPNNMVWDYTVQDGSSLKREVFLMVHVVGKSIKLNIRGGEVTHD